MAVLLLGLSTGHYSLEFEPVDVPAVRAAIIEQFGEPEIRQHATSAEYRFGGSSFTYQNEWDDPCLIAATDVGDEILRQLHRIINPCG